MFAFKPRIEIAARVFVIAAVLFNALIPTPVLAKVQHLPEGKYESASASRSMPKVERPERPKAVERKRSDQVAACQADTNNDLIVLNGNECALDAGSYTFHDITVQPDATLTLRGNPDAGIGVTLQAVNMTLDGWITADGQGYPAGMGPGKGTDGTGPDGSAGGAGYGGLGADGEAGAAGGTGYGDVYEPTSLGSGGGNNGVAAGGAGGGAIKIVADNLIVNGYITASGQYGEYELESDGGGGSGGSIWIISNTLSGSGGIFADGGSGCSSTCGGGGAGGRVAIDVPVEGNTFPEDELYASGDNQGGPGTIYLTRKDKLSVEYGDDVTPAVLLPGDYDFDIIELNSANLRILGEDSSLTIDADTEMLGYPYYSDYDDGLDRLELEGALHAPADLVIKAFMLVPLKGLDENIQNITIADKGGLELHADASPEPNGVYQFDNITVGNEVSGGISVLRLVSFHNENEDYSDDYGVTLQANNITVHWDGEIEANGQGYPGGMGPGKGDNSTGLNNAAGGAGYGGEGGDGEGGTSGGNGYGSIYAPTMLGSGGGNFGNDVGASGGGAIKLEVANAMLLDGQISANSGYVERYTGGGGGSGGSIWILANSLAGVGRIEAEGEDGTIYAPDSGPGYRAGNGAGGRVTIDVPVEGNTFLETGAIYPSGTGNNGVSISSADGTVYWVREDKLSVSGGCSNGKDTILEEGDYNFDEIEVTYLASARIVGVHSSLTVGNTIFTGNGTGRLAVEGTILAPTDFTFSGGVTLVLLNELQGAENITLQGGGGLELPAEARPGGAFSLGNITVANGGRLHLASFDNGDMDFTNDYGVTLQVNNLTVEAGGVVEADGEGYPGGMGPGKGANASGQYYEQAGGGGYGGAGGTGAGDNVGGISYGIEDIYTPTLLGSGGGNITNYARGGAGGGAFKLEVENALILNGVISSNGKDGNIDTGASGAGSGGSIWIVAPSVTGSGAIQANGGSGKLYLYYWWNNYPFGYSGCGGGGRIAVDTQVLDPAINVSAQGGSGPYYGGIGTVFLGVADPAKSQVEITPSANVTADGNAIATLKVTLLDTHNIPIIGEPVEIAVVSGSNLDIRNIGPVGTEYVPIGDTDSTGVVTAYLTTTRAGVRTLKAIAGQIPLTTQPTVEFVAGTLDAARSSLSVSRTTVPADGQTLSTVTVTAVDSFGNPVQGVTVALNVISEHATVTLSSGYTEPISDNEGQVKWDIKDSSSETVTVSATVNGQNLPYQYQRTIAFKGVDLNVWLAAPPEAPAGRNAEIPYVVTVHNDYYLPASETVVTLTLPMGVTCIDDTLEDVDICQAGQVVPWNIGLLERSEMRSFTLHAKIDSTWEIGETLQATVVATTTSAEENEANNSAAATTAMVSGYAFNVPESPVTQTVGIGGTAAYVIEVENTGLLADDYEITVTGPEGVPYTLSETSFGLLPQEKHQVTFSTQYDAETCGEQETHSFDFTVNITGQSENVTKPYHAIAIFQAAPTISDLQPAQNSLLGSRDVTISWRTDVPTTGILTVLGEPEGPLTYGPTQQGTSHSVLVQGLDAIPHEWSVTATSACGGTATTSSRQFSIETGVVFVQHQLSYKINRDYDQFAEVKIKNQSDQVREVQLSIEDPYEDLIVNFRGEGGVDGTITLLPREEQTVQLVIFAQDAALENYSFNALLTSTDGVQTITDVATINVRVLFPNNYTLEDRGVDSLTGATVYRVTNHGLPITDLNVRAVIADSDLPAPVYITPQIVHARLGTDQSLEFKLIPLYSAEDVTSATGRSSAKMLSPIPRAVFPDIDIITEVAKQPQRHPAQKGCDGEIYAVTLHNVILPLPFHSWYCTNRPNIDISIEVPPFVNPNHVTGSMLEMNFSPVSAMRPHNTTLYFNGHEISQMQNQVPNGSMRFGIPPSYLRTNTFFGATQTISLRSVHNNNGGDEPHHVSQVGGTLYIALDEVTVYVCANSQEEAEAIARAGFLFVNQPAIFDVFIQNPMGGLVTPDKNGYVNLSAQVMDSNYPYINLYQVEADIQYEDASTETVFLFDDGVNSHGDSVGNDRYFNAMWMPKRSGLVHMKVTAKLLDGREDSKEISFQVHSLPDLTVTNVYIKQVSLANQAVQVVANIANIGLSPALGPINVEFRYYRIDSSGNPTDTYPFVTHPYFSPETLNPGQSIQVEDNQFTSSTFSGYYVVVVVDP